MKKLMIMCVLVGSLSASAQVQIAIGFPAPPPLVVVSPGVMVVEDYDEEIYFVDNWYWVRRDNFWYRTRSHRGGWVVVHSGIPATIIGIPPGKYRKYKGGHSGAVVPASVHSSPLKQSGNGGNHGSGHGGGGGKKGGGKGGKH
jgi:hypothetical protein